MSSFLITVAAVLAANALTVLFGVAAVALHREHRQGRGETEHSLWIYPALLVPLLFFGLGAYLIDNDFGAPAATQKSLDHAAG